MQISEKGSLDARKKCCECNREFDLWDEIDAEEWYYGHDCEAVSVQTKTEYINRAMDKLS